MNILKWFEYLPEDLWNILVCLAHEQGIEDVECDNMSQAIYRIDWESYDVQLLHSLAQLGRWKIFQDYRLISEEDWELLEEAKKQKDKEREFVSRVQHVKTPEVLGWPNFVNKNIDVINRDMGKPIKSKK